MNKIAGTIIGIILATSGATGAVSQLSKSPAPEFAAMRNQARIMRQYEGTDYASVLYDSRKTLEAAMAKHSMEECESLRNSIGLAEAFALGGLKHMEPILNANADYMTDVSNQYGRNSTSLALSLGMFAIGGLALYLSRRY
jgi:hypothetical protein